MFGLWTLDLAHLHSASSAQGLDVYFKDLWLLALKCHVFGLIGLDLRIGSHPIKRCGVRIMRSTLMTIILGLYVTIK